MEYKINFIKKIGCAKFQVIFAQRLSVNNLPAFGSFSDNGDGTGKIRFVSGFGDAGVYPNIRVIAIDNGTPSLSDTTSFTLTVTAAAARHDIVINEILYDPNHNDLRLGSLGTERIELRNVGANTVLLQDWALWIRRDTLDTFWQFPNTAAIAPGALLVVHWLTSGNNDAGNLFTDRPFDSGSRDDRADKLWGNNSATVDNMTLGGSNNSNNVSFALAVVQLVTIIIPDIAVEPTRLDFGLVPVGSGGREGIIVVSNNGTTNLEVSATQVIGADLSEFEVTAGEAPFTLAPGESRDVTIRFNPVSGGIRSATLRIRSNDADEDQFDVPLEGFGILLVKVGIAPDSSRVIDFVQLGRSVPVRDRMARQKRLRSQEQLNDFTMIDFIQIGGSVAGSESIAVKAGLWRRGDSLEFAPEGHSYELTDNPVDTLLTTRNDFFLQPSPSIGFKNVLAPPLEKHLLISEICVRPGHSEFIEIFNPDSINAVPLADYYLTDVGGRDNAYMRLVKGPDSLQINGDDFFVRFPDNATIRPLQYQTIAISANDFIRRYRTRPTYEIVGDDTSASNNMRPVKPSIGIPITKPDLADAGEMVVLLKWNGNSDLLQDVDFVAWGKISTADSINKTGFGVDGRDADNFSSYYDNDTDFALQHAIANQAHDILKSWQRRPTPREFGELRAGGNGISGHDETSERLEEAFRELPPTPIGPPPDDGSGDDELDLDFVTAIAFDTLSNNGNRDGIVNPGEAIRMFVTLKNNAPNTTGPLFSVLRFFSPYDQFVMLGADSTANYPPIAPDGIAQSVDSYEFSAKPILFPDTLRVIRFIIFVVDKQTGQTLQAKPQQITIPGIEKVNKESTLGTQSVPSSQSVAGQVQAASPNLNIVSSALSVDGSNLLAFITLKNTGGAPTGIMCGRLDIPDINPLSTPKHIENIPCSETNNPSCTLDPSASMREEKFSITIPTTNTRLNTPTPLCGTLVIRGSTFNADLPVSLTIPFVSVTVKYPKTSLLVPNLRINLIERTTTTTSGGTTVTNDLKESKPTDTHGQVTFNSSSFNLLDPTKSYFIHAVAPLKPNAPHDLRKIDEDDLDDGITTCSQRVMVQSPDDILLGDANQMSGFTSNDCNAIEAFVNAAPMTIAAIPSTADSTGRWAVADPNATTPAAVESVEVAFSTTNKFYSLNAMLLGDLNASWLPATPPFFYVDDPGTPITCTITTPSSPCPSGSERAAEIKGNQVFTLPAMLELYQNYPNPLSVTSSFQLGTIIRFALPKPDLVSMKIYDILGQLVKNLVEKPLPSGVHNVVWRGDNESGGTAVSGLYFVRLQAGNAVKVQRIVLVR
ncbi:choice-of-anchor D domain-containing protein [candidate division KSB1 bacterium]|nr:choice-of-anchor D domain-containing protein [candidate division KSB1 bacterium]